MYSLLSRYLGRFPPISISGRWILILLRIRGVDPKEELKLIASALYDIFRSLLKPKHLRNPEAIFPMLLRTKDGIVFRTRPRSDDVYFMLPGRERDVHSFIMERLKKARVFVDVGANVGYYTIRACRMGVENVISVEAHPENFKVLKRNVELNGCKAELVNKAVWNESGLKVSMEYESGQRGMSRIGSENGNVETITLNDLLKEYESIDLLKMDIEGAEYKALLGAGDVLRRIGSMVLEVSKDEENIRELLERYGFIVKKADFSKHLVAIRSS